MQKIKMLKYLTGSRPGTRAEKVGSSSGHFEGGQRIVETGVARVRMGTRQEKPHVLMRNGGWRARRKKKGGRAEQMDVPSVGLRRGK